MKCRFSLLLAGCLIAAATASSPAADLPAAGASAPPIALQQILQAPDGTRATLESLHGKVVVLEFWATWCPGCVKAIPHLNELIDSLKDEPVQFISVTDEKPEVVAAFLTKKPIHGWVGIDATGAMFNAYGMGAKDAARPRTIVIRPDGTVDACIVPWVPSLTRDSLLRLAAGKPSGLVDVTEVYGGQVRDENGNPLPDVWVWATNAMSDGWRMIGTTKTDGQGRFNIISDQPIVYLDEYPIRLSFTQTKNIPAGSSNPPLPPDHPEGMLEDLRLFPASQQRDLSVKLHTAPRARWRDQ